MQKIFSTPFRGTQTAPKFIHRTDTGQDAWASHNQSLGRDVARIDESIFGTVLIIFAWATLALDALLVLGVDLLGGGTHRLWRSPSFVERDGEVFKLAVRTGRNPRAAW